MKLATLAFITKNNQVLLGLKGKGVEIGEGTLNGPGGKLDPEKDGTSLSACMVREIKEEVSLLVQEKDLEKMAVVTFYASGIPDFEVHVFKVHAFTGEPTPSDEMIPGWYELTPETFSRMLDADSQWWPRLASGEKFNANVYYRERAKGLERIEFLPFTP